MYNRLRLECIKMLIVISIIEVFKKYELCYFLINF